MKLHTIFILAIAIATATGCQNFGKSNNALESTEPTVVTHNSTGDSDVTYDNNNIDNEISTCAANELAMYIAGKSNDKYAELQQTDFYRTYAANTQQTWNELCQRTLNPVQQWCKSNIPDFYNDTTCILYPFGGPDMIFAMTFFPNEKDYILMGLENPGDLCDPTQLTDLERRQYLDSLSFSMRYVNKYGFFVASHMISNFRNKNMDGTIHVVLYTLAMNDCIITSHRNIYIDNFGEIQTSDGTPQKHPYGWELTFHKKGESRTRTVKYLRMDLSDPMIKGQMEFPFFLNSIKNKTCYLKSASYLMQSVEFGVVRKLILDQFDKILQDESGFAYGRLIKDYDVRLFGTYTRPLKVFSIFKQDDLKAALANSQPLPFKIGYASQLNESVLMACTRKDPNSISTVAQQNITSNTNINKQNTNSNDTIYKVQFYVSWKILSKNAPELNGVNYTDYYTDNNAYKYTIGNFKNEQECMSTLQNVRDKGFKDAFIVKFCNGKRIR